ncbi:MAG: prepilin-type N-terminal cleavage/methylation domain-containing protein [Puniceicoccales bacterium]|jgi:prepilin-type N-terminal cleavage/methylation domain-containing protein|nr:prepilin-type N-terminal cleavage/methylation domain-containing protein [Puniceicoccales bacterium]
MIGKKSVSRKTRGFTLIELLFASAIACSFVLTVLALLVKFGFYGEVFRHEDERSTRSEQALMFNEISSEFSSKNFFDKIVVEKPRHGHKADDLSLEFRTADIPDFFQFENSGEALIRFEHKKLSDKYGVDLKDSSGKQLYRVFVRCEQNQKRVEKTLFARTTELYLKPIWTPNHYDLGIQSLMNIANGLQLPKGYHRNSSTPDTWSDGQVLRFCQHNLHGLAELHKNGIVSRVFITTKKQ